MRRLLILQAGRVCVRLALVALAVGASDCAKSDRAHNTTRLTIATGGETGIYYLLGSALANLFNSHIPGVASTAIETAGSGANIQAIQDGRADIGFTQADSAYLAYASSVDSQPRKDRVRAIAVLYVNAVQIIALRESAIHSLDQLAGRRVGIGAPQSGTQTAARLILQAAELDERITRVPVAFDEFASELESHEVDAGFLVSSYPVPAISRLNATGLRLLPIKSDLANRIRGAYPFYHPIVVPTGTYEGQERDVETIGVDNLLVCSADLPDDVVYTITRLFIESLATLSRSHVAAASIDPWQAQAAPIPLHSGAARFYRERELFR